MDRYISNSSMSLLVGLVLLLSANGVFAQQKETEGKISTSVPEKKKELKKDTVQVYNGIVVGTNLLGLAEVFFPSKILSPEVSVQVMLFRKLFPTFEIGIATGSAPVRGGGDYRIGIAPFFRIGADYKVIGTDEKNLFYLGIRYGMTPFSYSITGVVAQNEYWGQTTPLDVISKSTVEHWVDIVGGLKVSLSKTFAMGWNVRYRLLLPNGSSELFRPSFIPGFGLRSVNNDCISVQYCLYFRL